MTGPSRSLARTQRVGVRALFFLVAWVTPPVVAQELRELPLRESGAVDQAPPATTAPNQSISIDDVQAARSDSKSALEAATSDRVETDSANPSSSKADPTLTPSDRNDDRQDALPRGVRRRGAAEFGFGSTSARSTPWYRTGLGALSVVLVLIGGLYVFARKWLPRARVAGDDRLMRVISRTTLSPRQSLALVRIGQRCVVVGLSPDRVEAVCEITDSDEVNCLVTQANGRGQSGSSGFANWLNREAADFVRYDKETVAAREPVDKRQSPASKSLTDLLHRVRAMKSGG